MPAKTLNRSRHGNVQPRGEQGPRLPFRAVLTGSAAWAVLLGACFLFDAAGGTVAGAQASQQSGQQPGEQQAGQVAGTSNSSPQSSPAQPGAAGQQGAPNSGSGPAAAPMVMGEGADSADTGGAPAQAAPSAAQQPNASPAPGKLVLWNPAKPPGEAAPAAPAATAAPSEALPVPAPADAGGNSARQQINDECANLMQMANDLKAAVDKSTKDMLSVAVVRKANDIESLAHHVKDDMRPEVGKK